MACFPTRRCWRTFTPTPPATGGALLDDAARSRAAAEQVEALSIKTPSLEASAAQLSGGTQQGRPRQVVARPSERPPAGRADARHRRRRQGGDPRDRGRPRGRRSGRRPRLLGLPSCSASAPRPRPRRGRPRCSPSADATPEGRHGGGDSEHLAGGSERGSPGAPSRSPALSFSSGSSSS